MMVMSQTHKTCSKEKLLRLSVIFRTALVACEKDSLVISLRDFPSGSCSDASYLLAKYLGEMGCGKFNYVVGIRKKDEWSHVWLEQDSIIVDITADQFEENESEVIVTSDVSFHQQFKEDQRWVADYRKYDDDRIVSGLNESYTQVLTEIET